MTAPYITKISRRTSLKWLAGAMGLATGAAACSPTEEAGQDTLTEEVLLGHARSVTGSGYGVDPDMFNSAVPWRRTMTEEQLRLTAALSDMILPDDGHSPAASTLGVPDFIDEWVSAPYEGQRNDRKLFFSGFEWLERQSRERFETGFADATDEQRAEILDLIAWRERQSDAPEEMRNFFRSFRNVAGGAYYSTEAGMADIGYLGNRPIIGKYPGPTSEALDHLQGVLTELGLEMPAAN